MHGQWPVIMNVSPSPYFDPVDLRAAYNARREELPEELKSHESVRGVHGVHPYRGISFDLGAPDANDVILLDRNRSLLT